MSNELKNMRENELRNVLEFQIRRNELIVLELEKLKMYERFLRIPFLKDNFLSTLNVIKKHASNENIDIKE